MKKEYKNHYKYSGDARYERVYERMQLLGIQDVTTTRQHKNGTIVWKLPIKNSWMNGKLIEVASFKTGYVRNQNSGYSNYQLNKRVESEPQYYPVHEWCDDANDYVKTDKFRQYTTRSCVLIPIEIERLEYLISYCLKNYYIKRANEVADGKLIPKWTHEWELEKANSTYGENTGAMERIDDLSCKIHDLENKLSNAISPTKHECAKQYSVKLEEKLYDLQNKLATINRISE
jgi:glutamine synthetase type III